MGRRHAQHAQRAAPRLALLQRGDQVALDLGVLGGGLLHGLLALGPQALGHERVQHVCLRLGMGMGMGTGMGG